MSEIKFQIGEPVAPRPELFSVGQTQFDVLITSVAEKVTSDKWLPLKIEGITDLKAKNKINKRLLELLEAKSIVRSFWVFYNGGQLFAISGTKPVETRGRPTTKKPKK